MRSPGKFLSGEFLKVKDTCRFSTEYPPELRRVQVLLKAQREKRVENTTLSGEFFTKLILEVFG